MKLGLFVNDVRTEQPGYTTVRLAMAAINLDHEVWLMGAGDLTLDADGSVAAHARTVPKARYKKSEVFLSHLQGPKAVRERIVVDELDILVLRNDPSEDQAQRAWAQSVGITFGRVAASRGVAVLNDPNGLSRALNKIYLHFFPEELQPRTIVTRNRDDVRAFVRAEGGTAILKPLQGSGGQGVFLVRPEDRANLNQMIDAIARDGYVIAQEYLPGTEEGGDVRLFLMNGVPLRHRGKVAAFGRIRSGDDIRSNVSAGGKLRRAELTDLHFRIADMVRPRLAQDGMFLVGLDIADGKLMEINVFSPGGLGSAQKFEGVNFARAVVHALERKADYMGYYRRRFDNAEIALL